MANTPAVVGPHGLADLAGLAREGAAITVGIRWSDMSDNARDAAVAEAKSRSDVAKSEAERENYRSAIPAQQEQKRDVGKTRLIVLAVLAIVGVAAVKLNGPDLVKVLIACVGVLTAAWGVTEGINAYAKRKAKALVTIA